VVFDRDIRSDDAKATLTALRQIRGVLKVTPNLTDISDTVAEMRAEQRWRERIAGLFSVPESALR
jgi:hypothetical protein